MLVDCSTTHPRAHTHLRAGLILHGRASCCTLWSSCLLEMTELFFFGEIRLAKCDVAAIKMKAAALDVSDKDKATATAMYQSIMQDITQDDQVVFDRHCKILQDLNIRGRACSAATAARV